eukprot:TRINITY_DN38979_c0_g1_i1.p1 TRINITY_DN38979_c0_g1~~TRINITY_DN38979_c0_g1_i1.p1  ORF type:complete len:806 (-),score=182.46 TRINITY_DN38979_c0_g1_i1:305-2722(-)
MPSWDSRASTSQSSSATWKKRASRPVTTLLKERFCQGDVDGNGMVDFEELSVLLRKGNSRITDEEIQLLFSSVDNDGSGQINFDEFLEFVFPRVANDDEYPALRKSLAGSLMRKGELEEVKREDASEQAQHRREVSASSMQIYGGTLKPKVNARYDKRENDWIVCSSAGESRFEGVFLNGKPMYVYVKKKLRLFLFYGWTANRERVGWFISTTELQENEPVQDFIFHNPSPYAEAPSLCRAAWVTGSGQRDKRMFCEMAEQEEEPDDEDICCCCLEEELWDATSDEDSSDPEMSESEEDGCNWDVEVGEDFKRDSSDSESSESEAAEPEPEVVESGGGEYVPPRRPVAKHVVRPRRVRRRPSKPKKRRAGPIMRLQVAPGFVVVRKSVATEGKTAEALPAVPPHGDEPAKAERRRKKKNKAEDEEDLREQAPKHQKRRKRRRQEFEIMPDGFFRDPDFPPSLKSLGDTSVEVDGWQRLSTLHEKPCLFRSVLPEDVWRLQESNCSLWLSSATAAVCEYPSWLLSIFGNRLEMSQSCKYTVRLYHPGMREFLHIDIDDYVPTRGGRPAFAGITSEGELWPALIEKAFAKMCGSYGSTEWGRTEYGMLYLCGGGVAESWSCVRGPPPREKKWKRSYTAWNGSSEDVHLDRSCGEGSRSSGQQKDADQMWAMLRRYMELCFPVACEIDRSEAESCGLLPDRSYSLIGAREVPAEDGMELRMVCLRNPFGVGKWSGRWSDTSEAWEENEAARLSLQFTPSRMSGTFWMSYIDFLRYFEIISVVKKSMPLQGCGKIKRAGLKRALGIVKN